MKFAKVVLDQFQTYLVFADWHSINKIGLGLHDSRDSMSQMSCNSS